MKAMVPVARHTACPTRGDERGGEMTPQRRFERAIALHKYVLELHKYGFQVKAAGCWLPPPSSSQRRWAEELSEFVAAVSDDGQQAAASAAGQQPAAPGTQWKGLPSPATSSPAKKARDNKTVDLDEDIEPLPGKNARHNKGQALVCHHVGRDDDEKSAEDIDQSEPDESDSEEDELGIPPDESKEFPQSISATES